MIHAARHDEAKKGIFVTYGNAPKIDIKSTVIYMKEQQTR